MRERSPFQHALAFGASFAGFVLVVSAVAYAAGVQQQDELELWPSSLAGRAQLEALAAPPFDTTSLVIPPADGSIIESEFPPGSAEFYRHPTVIARYIHGLYSSWLDADLDAPGLASLRSHADFLLESLELREVGGIEFGTWPLPMPNPEFDVGPNWTSAFTNAAGALALVQASRVLPDRAAAYTDAAALALASLEVDTRDGGASTTHDDGGVCLEEVAAPAEPTCILNGHLFAMGYLYSLGAGSTFDTRALLARGDEYVRTHLATYSTRFASKYSPTGKYAEPGGYNHLQGSQLLWLFAVTGNRDYYDTAALWAQFDGPGFTNVLSTNRTIDPVDHAPDILSDGPAWYGYWSASGNAVVEIELVEVAPICGFNVFYVAGREPSSVAASVGDRSDVSISVVDEDTSGGDSYRTAVVAYRFDTCVTADSLRVDFLTGDRGVVAVREIDVIVRSDTIAKERLRSMYAGVDASYREIISLRSVGIYP